MLQTNLLFMLVACADGLQSSGRLRIRQKIAAQYMGPILADQDAKCVAILADIYCCYAFQQIMQKGLSDQ